MLVETTIYFILIAILLPGLSSAQATRGAWLLSSEGQAQWRLDLPNDDKDFNASIAPIVGYFVTDQWMPGISPEWARAYSRSDNAEYIFNGWGVTPLVRYYLPPSGQKLQFFLTAGSRFYFEDAVFKTPFSELKSYTSSIGTFLGGGLNLFVLPGLAMEGNITYRSSYEKRTSNHNLDYRFGLQYFLIPRQKSDTEVRTFEELRQRTWLLSAVRSIRTWRNIGETNDNDASSRLAAGYFLSRRWAAGTSLFIAFARENSIIYPEPFARFYFGAADSRWQPFATAGFGTRFQLADRVNDPGFFNLNVFAGAGLNYFLHPSVALETVLQYNVRRVEEQNNSRFLNLEIGFSFFLR